MAAQEASHLRRAQTLGLGSRNQVALIHGGAGHEEGGACHSGRLECLCGSGAAVDYLHVQPVQVGIARVLGNEDGHLMIGHQRLRKAEGDVVFATDADAHRGKS